MCQFIVNALITVSVISQMKINKMFCFIFFLMNKIYLVSRISFVTCMRTEVQASSCINNTRWCLYFKLRWSCVILCTGNYVTGTLWEQKFWNVLLGVHILGKLHLEWGWTGNRGNFRHPGWESPVSGHWPVDWDHGTPQGRSGISELCTPGTYRWMMDTYSYI